MTVVEMSYGHGHVRFELNNGCVGERFTSGGVGDVGAGDMAISHALKNPLRGSGLDKLVEGKRVLALIEDYTRSEPHGDIVEGMSPYLKGAKEVVFLVSTGSHSPSSDLNKDIIATIKRSMDAHALQGEYAIHSAYGDDWLHLGQTSRGTPLKVNPLLGEGDIIVVGADMKPHYFAGYSCAVKDFLPGICAFETIEHNHSFALRDEARAGYHPFHPSKARRKNPVAEDMVEAMDIIARKKTAVTLSTVSSKGHVLWSAFGPIHEVCEGGIRYIDANLAMKAKERYKYVVISPGGHPQDESLYNAQRCLELTLPLYKSGAKVLLLAECENGIAPTEKARRYFYEPLMDGAERAMKVIEKEYHLYSHKAYRMAKFMTKHEVYIHSRLPTKEVEHIGLIPAPDPQELLAQWEDDCLKTGKRIAFVDGGNKIMIVPP